MMEAGVYYVGDLCYYLRKEWKEVCGRTESDGEFTLNDGRRFAFYSTAYGDGGYPDQFGNEYCVDSGSIGCVQVSGEYDPVELNKLGKIVIFTEPFETSVDDGIIKIGHLEIDTKGSEEEDYEQ